MEDVITLFGAKLYFRNFAGEEGIYNKKGDRNFGVFIEDDLAARLENAGWNVKRTKPDEDGYSRAYIKVKVNFKGRPKLYLVTSGNKTLLTEDNVDELDSLVFENVDLKIRRAYLSRYDQYAQYLDKGFFTALEDELDKKYFGQEANQFEEDTPF